MINIVFENVIEIIGKWLQKWEANDNIVIGLLR